jgi:hypothetical protein
MGDHEYTEGYDPELNRVFGRYCSICGVLRSLHPGVSN